MLTRNHSGQREEGHHRARDKGGGPKKKGSLAFSSLGGKKAL